MEETRKMPKNVCQIGGADRRLRVYLEDYVNMFLKQAAAAPLLGVLLGESCVQEGMPHVFVQGALVLEGAVLADGTLCVGEDLRTGIGPAVEKNFPGAVIVGWFVSGDVGSELDLYQCQKLKRQLLSARETLLCVNQTEERTFYRMTGEDCLPLNGYYIYYEKNRNMQEYMRTHPIVRKKAPAAVPETEAAWMAQSVLREHPAQKPRARSGRLAYGLCAALTIFLAASGTLILGGKASDGTPRETEAQVNAEAETPESGVVINDLEGNVYPTVPETEPEETTEEASDPTAS